VLAESLSFNRRSEAAGQLSAMLISLDSNPLDANPGGRRVLVIERLLHLQITAPLRRRNYSKINPLLAKFKFAENVQGYIQGVAI
jgi:hypothetical protein